jgi:hypothetical protein
MDILTNIPSNVILIFENLETEYLGYVKAESR